MLKSVCLHAGSVDSFTCVLSNSVPKSFGWFGVNNWPFPALKQRSQSIIWPMLTHNTILKNALFCGQTQSPPPTGDFRITTFANWLFDFLVIQKSVTLLIYVYLSQIGVKLELTLQCIYLGIYLRKWNCYPSQQNRAVVCCQEKCDVPFIWKSILLTQRWYHSYVNWM